MRFGANPVKDNPNLSGYGRHRVIMPVYIPNEEGYFKQALEVLRLSLDSLELTGAGQIKLTVIVNAATAAVEQELVARCKRGTIDQLLFNQVNRGKIDAVLAAARGAYEELVTISDCDILFKSGWSEAVESVFMNFPECASVSPLPSPGLCWYETSSTVTGAWLGRCLGYGKVISDEDINRFSLSVSDSADRFSKEEQNTQIYVDRNGTKAVIGCTHCVATYRRQLIFMLPFFPLLKGISGDSVKVLDETPDQLGYWRLSTAQAFAYHMGNVPESWMDDEMNKIRETQLVHTADVKQELPPLRADLTAVLPYHLRVLISRLIRGYYRHLVQKKINM